MGTGGGRDETHPSMASKLWYMKSPAAHLYVAYIHVRPQSSKYRRGHARKINPVRHMHAMFDSIIRRIIVQQSEEVEEDEREARERYLDA